MNVDFSNLRKMYKKPNNPAKKYVKLSNERVPSVISIFSRWFTTFVDYALKSYITLVLKLFLPAELLAETPSSNKRTTDEMESCHKDYNSLFHTSHPSTKAYKVQIRQL